LSFYAWLHVVDPRQKCLWVSQKWIWEMEQGKHGLLMERLFMVLEKTGVTLSAEFEVKEGSS